MRAGSKGETVAQHLRIAHEDAAECGIEEESDEYWGFLAGWLGATAWAMDDSKKS